MSTSMLNNDMLVVDADSHWCEPPDLFTKLAPPEYKDRVPRVEEVDGQTMWVFDGHPIGRFSAAGVIDRDGHEGERRHRAQPLDDRPGPRRGLRPEGAPRGAGRVRDRRAGHLPEHHRPRRAGPRQVEDDGAVPPGDRDLQRRHGRDPGGVGQPPPPDAAHAGVGHRHLHRRGQARGGARGARREHDVRPAGPRRARPRQPGVGPVLGACHRPPAPGALPHRRQRHRHDVLRPATRGPRTR